MDAAWGGGREHRKRHAVYAAQQRIACDAVIVGDACEYVTCRSGSGPPCYVRRRGSGPVAHERHDGGGELARLLDARSLIVTHEAGELHDAAGRQGAVGTLDLGCNGGN